MDDGYLLGPAALKQVAEVVRIEHARLKNPDGGHRQQRGVNESEVLQGFLVGALAAATATVNGETTAELYVWYHDASLASLVYTGRTITVTNRDTGFARAADSYLMVTWIEGEWRPFVNSANVTFLAKNGASVIAARASTTVGSGTVTIWSRSGTTIATTGVTVAVYNWSAMEVAANAYILIHQDGFGTWWIGSEDCT